MKRALVLAALLLLAAPVAFMAAVRQVDSRKENIVITESTLYGNPEAAAGLRLKMAFQWDGRLLWDTSYAVGSGETENRFTYSDQRVDWRQSVSEIIYMDFVVNWGTAGTNGRSGPFDPENAPLSEVVRAVMERTKPGERRTETVFLREYYEYYPLFWQLDNDNYNVHYDSRSALTGDADDFTDFYSIPVSDKEILRVTLEKDEAGDVIDVQCVQLSGLGIMNRDAFGSQGAYHAYVLYGSVNVDYQEESIRTGNYIEGIWPEPGENYGIYYYPYTNGANCDQTADLTIDPEQGRKVCDLKPGINLMDMELSETEDRLYLVTKEGQGCYLSAYDVEETGLILRQKLFVRSEAEEQEAPYWCRLEVHEEGTLMVWQDGSFAFAVLRGEEMKLWCLEQESVLGPLFSDNNWWDFDGERLAIASYADAEKSQITLAVCTEDGLVYQGLCGHSMNMYPEEDEPYSLYRQSLSQSMKLRNLEWE